MTKDPHDDKSRPGEVPPSLMELWVFAVATMPADVLDAFAVRIRRAWPDADLAPLEHAITERRRTLGLPTSPRHDA